MEINRLWHQLSERRKKQFLLLQIMIIISSFFEMLSLGAVVPFLTALSEPELIFRLSYLDPFIDFFGINEEDDITLPLTLVFICLIIFSALVRLILLWAMVRVSFLTGADLSIAMYRNTLYQDYAVHVSRNSSEVINGIITKTRTVTSGIIYPILSLISSIVTILGILGILALVNVSATLSAFLGFGFLYLLVMLLARNSLNRNSQLIANKSDLMVRSLQEGLEGVREVLINNNQEFYTELYKNSDLEMRQASWRNEIITASPRLGMEAIGIVAISIFAYLVNLNMGGIDKFLPAIGVFVLGAQRLLPALQAGYGSYSRIKGSKYSLIDVVNLLEQPIVNKVNPTQNKSFSFDKAIELKSLGFRYSKESPWVLKNINLTIPKGSVTGIFGKTGCGKSTLLDILTGLLNKSSGYMKVDNHNIDDMNKKSWQSLISCVPQHIYLIDNTIEQNIAFGFPKEKIDPSRIEKVAKLAQISDLIESWEDGYQTLVGERGMRISGGQRQRIGIARALYKQSDVILLDEATSALDQKTEEAVMNSINNLDKDITLIIISHRLTSLKNCSQILKFDDNYETRKLSYKEIIKNDVDKYVTKN